MSPTRERSRLRPKNPETPKSSASALKNMVTYPPPTHTFLKRPFLTDFKKHTHTPPKVTTYGTLSEHKSGNNGTDPRKRSVLA